MLAQTTLLLAEGAQSGALTQMLPFILMIGVFYFLVMRPMKKQEDERKQRLAELKRGDKIVLTGGVLGRISRIEDQIAIVEIADKVKIRVLKKDISDFEEDALKSASEDKKGGFLANLLGGGGSGSSSEKDSGDSDSQKAG